MKKTIFASLVCLLCLGNMAYTFDYFGYKVRAQMVPRMSPETVTVAALQIHSTFGDVEKNRSKISSKIYEASKRGAKIIVLPEGALQGYLSEDLKKGWRTAKRMTSEKIYGYDPSTVAETVPGPSSTKFCEMAKRLSLYIALPLIEVDRKTDDYYSTCLFIGPDGNILLHYRKLTPYAWAEKGWITVGNRGTPVVDTEYGRVGILICSDIHRQVEMMKKLKVDILIHPAAWIDARDSEWFSKNLPQIARKSNFDIVVANWTVTPNTTPRWFGYGQSCIINSYGQVLSAARKNNAEEIVYADIKYEKQPVVAVGSAE